MRYIVTTLSILTISVVVLAGLRAGSAPKILDSVTFPNQQVAQEVQLSATVLDVAGLPCIGDILVVARQGDSVSSDIVSPDAGGNISAVVELMGANLARPVNISIWINPGLVPTPMRDEMAFVDPVSGLAAFAAAIPQNTGSMYIASLGTLVATLPPIVGSATLPCPTQSAMNVYAETHPTGNQYVRDDINLSGTVPIASGGLSLYSWSTSSRWSVHLTSATWGTVYTGTIIRGVTTSLIGCQSGAVSGQINAAVLQVYPNLEYVLARPIDESIPTSSDQVAKRTLLLEDTSVNQYGIVKSGAYTIRSLPPGDYTLEFWGPLGNDLPYFTYPASVQANSTTIVAF
jgi:hypothetical protein